MHTLGQMSIGQFPAHLASIFYYVVLPILLLAALGAVIQRVLGLDIGTLTRLNFYFTMPAMIYFSVVTSTSTISLGDVGSVVLFAALVLFGMGAITLAVTYLFKPPGSMRNVLIMTTMFHNSGNYGLPLQEMAFHSTGQSSEAAMIQVFYMLTQNVTNFTIGILLAATGGERRPIGQSLKAIARFPGIYALVLALITVQIRSWLGASAPSVSSALVPFWQTIVYAKSAFIAVALITLGAKLALVKRSGAEYPVSVSVVLRLLVGPILGITLTYLLGMSGFIAQVVVIATSTPTAVNCMLLCLEFDNHPDYAARAVFYSSLISPLTVTLTVFLAQGGFLPHLAI